jgi:hypothetical protein
MRPLAARVSTESRDTYRMGWFVRAPFLRTGETVQWNRAAARQASTFQAPGGRLFLTSTRLIHQPNRLAIGASGRPWSTPRTNISQITVEPRRSTIPLFGMTAGLRKRLRIELVDGSTQLFVVNHLNKVLGDLRANLANDTSPPATHA